MSVPVPGCTANNLMGPAPTTTTATNNNSTTTTDISMNMNMDSNTNVNSNKKRKIGDISDVDSGIDTVSGIDNGTGSGSGNNPSPTATVSVPNSNEMYDGFYAYPIYAQEYLTQIHGDGDTNKHTHTKHTNAVPNDTTVTRSNELNICYSNNTNTTNTVNTNNTNLHNPQPGTNSTSSTNSSLGVSRVSTITTDHSCDDSNEVRHMKCISTDSQPIRPGARDKAVNGPLAMNRYGTVWCGLYIVCIYCVCV